MDYKDTFEITKVPVTCTEGGTHTWLTADFLIKAKANDSNTAYIVEVYTRITSTSDINWSGAGDIRVTCNGKNSSKQISLALYKPGITTWDGPVSFEFGAPGEVELNMDIDLDLTRTEGFSGRPGIDHTSDGGSLQHFYYNNFNITIGEDGGLEPLVTAPVVSLTYENNNIDTLSFKWSSDKELDTAEYKIDSGSWISINAGTSGAITISNLTPKTEYHIYFRGKANGLNSNEALATGTTLDIAHIVSIGECIFGQDITINISKPANRTLLRIWTVGNSLEPMFEMNAVNGNNIFTPTQEQLDQMYRCFSNSNNIPIHFTLITMGNETNWADTAQQKSLQLTGIVKTAHVSIDDIPRRAQVLLGIDNIPRRAIFWIGDENNKPRRCI